MSSTINQTQSDFLLTYQRNILKNLQNSSTPTLGTPNTTVPTGQQTNNNAQAAAAVAAAMAAAAYTTNLNNLYTSTAQQMQTLLQPINSYDYSNFINKDIDQQNKLNNFHTQLPNGNAHSTSTSSASPISSSRSSSSSIPLLSEPISPVLSNNQNLKSNELEQAQIIDQFQQQQQVQNPFLVDLPIKFMHDNGTNQDGSNSRRKNATKETTATLKAWLYEHRKNPYPSKGEKIMLAIMTKMTLTQVSTWFANARRRLKKENRLNNKMKKQLNSSNNSNSLKMNNNQTRATDDDEDDEDDSQDSEVEQKYLNHHDTNQNQNFYNGHNNSNNKRHLNEDEDDNESDSNDNNNNNNNNKKFKVDEKNFNIKPKIWSIADVCRI